MLYEVAVSCTSLCHVFHQFVYGSSLVIAWEYESFAYLFVKLTFLIIVVTFLFDLYGNEVLEQVHQIVTTQHILPDVVSGVAQLGLLTFLLFLWVFCTILITLIEWEETCFVASQTCCHERLFRPYSKMDQTAFELQQSSILGWAVCHILF